MTEPRSWPRFAGTTGIEVLFLAATSRAEPSLVDRLPAILTAFGSTSTPLWNSASAQAVYRQLAWKHAQARRHQPRRARGRRHRRGARVVRQDLRSRAARPDGERNGVRRHGRSVHRALARARHSRQTSSATSASSWTTRRRCARRSSRQASPCRRRRGSSSATRGATRHQIVDYREVQFMKTPEILRAMGLDAREGREGPRRASRQGPSLASTPSFSGFSRTSPAPCAPPSAAARPCGSRVPVSRAGACGSCPSAPARASRRSARGGSRIPARRSCAQSENLHSAASSLISENVVSRTSSSAQSCSSRIPGVSRSTAPEGSGTSSRWDVVCRPRPPALVSAVARTSRPAKRFTSVDLPTPDEPSRAIVRPGSRYGSSASRPSPVTALTGVDGHAHRHRLDLQQLGDRDRPRHRSC